MLQIFGSQLGAILTGFFGGLVSSTATTASLAKKSNSDPQNKDVSTEVLTFLAATIAMLLEGFAILLLGTKNIHGTMLIIFLGPAVTASVLIVRKTRNYQKKPMEKEKDNFDILPILKLSIFIVVILALSKLLQYRFGQSGLLFFTFIVSLFEIHGSLIANVQLHDARAFDARMLGNLATSSVAASLLSKLFLVYTIGSPVLKKEVKKYTLYLFLSLIVSWLFYSSIA